MINKLEALTVIVNNLVDNYVWFVIIPLGTCTF